MATSANADSCGVCGRTILSGERTREYVSPDGDSRAVCDLCRDRVEAAGWVPEGQQGAVIAERREPASVRGRRWMLRQISELRSAASPSGDGDEAGETVDHRPRRAEEALRELPPERRLPRYEPPDKRLRRAIDQFNASEHRRTVAGLARSLGPPRVAAVTGPEAPDEVRLTVAWELSWYQWEIQLAGERTRVRSLAKGSEISELEQGDRAWNARVDDDGKLELGPESNGGPA